MMKAMNVYLQPFYSNFIFVSNLANIIKDYNFFLGDTWKIVVFLMTLWKKSLAMHFALAKVCKVVVTPSLEGEVFFENFQKKHIVNNFIVHYALLRIC